MSRRSIRRILHDIEDMQGHEDEGLYYFPIENNLNEGYGLILGPVDTPYEHGFYLLHFTFPDSYPNEPPYCRYINFSGLRQSPNFHDNGTVCLSRLNTWDKDDPDSGHWLGSMDIYSVLNMIKLSVLTKSPLDHEPPYDHTQKDLYNSLKYDYIVKYANYDYNVNSIYDKMINGHTNIPDDIVERITEIIRDFVMEHYLEYINALHELSQRHNNQYYSCRSYLNASCLCEYDQVIDNFKDLFSPPMRPKPVVICKKSTP